MSRTERAKLPPFRWEQPGDKEYEAAIRAARDERHRSVSEFSRPSEPIQEPRLSEVTEKIRLALVAPFAGATILEVRIHRHSYRARVDTGTTKAILAFRHRRGKLVMVPLEWRGRTVSQQKLRNRPSKLPRKQRRATTIKAMCERASVYRRCNNSLELQEHLQPRIES